MGRFEDVVLYPETPKPTSQTTGTETIDLPTGDFLSQVMFGFSAAAGYSTTPALDYYNMITKLEVVVDGSTIIKSMDGKQCRALAAYHGLDMINLGWYGRSPGTDKHWWTFPIMFGRHLYDSEYMMDMSAYKDPKLKIHWDASRTSVDGVTYAAPGTPTVRFDVRATIYRGTPPKGVKGYIAGRELEGWTCLASTPRRVEIPIGYPLYAIYQRAAYDDDKMLDYFSNVKLDFDNGKWTPVNHGYHEFFSLSQQWFPNPFHYTIRKDVKEDYQLDLVFGMPYSFHGLNQNDFRNTIRPKHELTWNIQDLHVEDGAGVNCDVHQPVSAQISGLWPHQYMCIPCYRLADEGQDALPTDPWHRIDLETTTAAGANTSALMQTYAEYIKPGGG